MTGFHTVTPKVFNDRQTDARGFRGKLQQERTGVTSIKKLDILMLGVQKISDIFIHG
jgi:hypothetical protein